jgi:DNA-binding NarL/FixJ family response regulator
MARATVARMTGAGHVLIVEDDSAALRALTRYVADYGPVIAATSAREAVSHLQRDARWAALVVDLGLPDGSGLDVVSRARDVHPTTPTLIVTGNAEPEAVNAAFLLGAHYVIKPIGREHIQRFFEKDHATPPFGTRVNSVSQSWRARYGLSHAETDILRRGMMGQERQDMASDRGTSELTIKRQMADMRRLTGDAAFHTMVERALRELAQDRARPIHQIV